MAADSLRETRKVLDLFRVADLTAYPELIDDHHLEPIACREQRSRQPGHSGTDNDEIEITHSGSQSPRGRTSVIYSIEPRSWKPLISASENPNSASSSSVCSANSGVRLVSVLGVRLSWKGCRGREISLPSLAVTVWTSFMCLACGSL